MEFIVVISFWYYDDVFNIVFSFLLSYVFGFSECDGFNVNVFLIKFDNSIVVYMGIEMVGNKVKLVVIFNFFVFIDLGFLVE